MEVRDLYLADYLSMRDEITLEDLGRAMWRALDNCEGLALSPQSFNVVVHSTGGLVVREFLRQFCRGEDGQMRAGLSPVSNLLMLAPANFGSPLAKMGKSMVGRLFRGWKWDGFFETGENILNALELASPIGAALAKEDLFSEAFPVFDAAHTRVTVLTGSNAYDGRMKRLVHENGSDGTVRVATANLNARYYKVDFAQPDAPRVVEVKPNHRGIALAVLNRNHASITRDVKTHREAWREVVLSSLRVKEDAYQKHVARCADITRETFLEGRNRRLKETQKRFHEYMHVVFHVVDQYGNGLEDYFIEFYQEEGDDGETVMEKVHADILEKVKINSLDPSYRSFYFDMTDLAEVLDARTGMEVEMSVCVANISEEISYRNPPNVGTAGIRVFGQDRGPFFRPNETVFVELVIHRDPGERVFRIKAFKEG